MRLAAKNLGVVPSALSRKISDIEKELGTPLFVRSINGVTLTEAGELMKEHVYETIQSYNVIEEQLESVGSDDIQQVSISGPQSVIPTFLPSVMSEFHAMHSDVVTVFKGTSDISVGRLLENSHMDVVLAFDLQSSHSGVELSRCEFEVGAIVSATHPLAKRKSTSFKECLKYKLVLPEPVWPLRKRLDEAISAESISPDIVATSDSLEFIKTSIEKESCVGFATKLGFELELLKKTLCFVPIVSAKPLVQDFVIIARDELSDTKIGVDLINLLTAQLQTYKSRE